MNITRLSSPAIGFVCGVITLAAWLVISVTSGVSQPAKNELADGYSKQIQPLLKKYCLECHSSKARKGKLDLERFASLEDIRKGVHPWQLLIEQIEVGEMPPKNKPQPTDAERRVLLGWVRAMLHAEALARAGDPGKVALRRLNNAEFTNTIRDLTGVELHPAKEFPADSAAGEGFANTGETLAMSPTLIDRYLKAAKHIAAHAVFLPDGIRFSPSTSRREWSADMVTKLRALYGPYGKNGTLAPERHWAAVILHRDEIANGRLTLDALAQQEKLSSVYLRHLWSMMIDEKSSLLLAHTRTRWLAAGKNDVADIAAEIAALQKEMWKPGKRVAHYSRYLEPQPPKMSGELKMNLELTKDQKEVVVYLAAEGLTKDQKSGHLTWQNPRLTLGKQLPILLRDVSALAPRVEAKLNRTLADTEKYLAATVKLRDDPRLDVKVAAKEAGLEVEILQRWIEYAALPMLAVKSTGKPVMLVKETAIPLKLLALKNPSVQKKHIHAWSHNSNDRLPTVVSNNSDKDDNIPGFLPAHKVALHPTPAQFVGIAWTSPIAGKVNISAQITHAHPACGNGVVWWLEHRRGNKAEKHGKGALDLGANAAARADAITLDKGDVILVAVGPRDGDHSCDLTGVEFTITEQGEKGRRWDLAQDVANTLLEANPHADRQGNKETWQFVFGADPNLKFPPGKGAAKGAKIPAGSILADWREVAGDPKRLDRLPELAGKVQSILIAKQLPATKADQDVRATLSALNGPLFQGIDVTKWLTSGDSVNQETDKRFGIDPARFGKHPSGQPVDSAHLVVPIGTMLEVRIPAALAVGRQLTTEVVLDSSTMARASLQPAKDSKVQGSSAWLMSSLGADKEKTAQAVADFQRLFPLALFYPDVVPGEKTQEVTLRMYYREDEALCRLMLDTERKRQLDRLWSELHFISEDALKVHEAYPQFMGFVSQDGDVKEFEPYRVPIRLRAEAFQKEKLEAQTKHVMAVIDFAALAYRRPLLDAEKDKLRTLYQTMRKKDVNHEDAVRSLLARVLVSPHFLYRLENPPAGAKAGPVTDLELATRLSYFLWASTPDEELRKAASASKLRDTKTLVAQTDRMLKSPRIRGLATEFGMQWLQVRDIVDHKDKSEKLFPTFDDKLRHAFFEESALFFEDLFQNDRSVLNLIDADYTFVNDALAKHYGLSNIKGSEWRKIDGSRKFGRGGVLTLSSVLTKQAGASRTSPILRGNWVVDTLLGEKLPRPPANVPQLPEAEDASKLTVRQIVEQHTKNPACANCHRRIDPYGFALENYDAIGRWRQKDLGGRPVETKVELRDGTKFDGVAGLKQYLLTERRDEFLRTFCRKLLGYSLGRSVMLSDQPLIDEMVASLRKNDYRVSAAILPIVQSTQFRYIRGLEAAKGDHSHE